MTLPSDPTEPAAPRLLELPLAVQAAALGMAGAFTAGAFVNSVTPYVAGVVTGLIALAGRAFALHYDQIRPGDRRAGLSHWWWGGSVALVASGLLGLLESREMATSAILLSAATLLHLLALQKDWGVDILAGALRWGVSLLVGAMALPDHASRAYLPMIVIVMQGVGWGLLRASRLRTVPVGAPVISLMHLAGAAAFAGLVVWTQSPEPMAGFPLLMAAVMISLPRVVRAVLDGRPGFAFEALQYCLFGTALLAAAMAGAADGIIPGLIVAALCAPLYAAIRRGPVELHRDRR